MSVIKKVSSKIKHLRLNPLSVAKYFGERGIEDVAINQHLTYFTCLEVMKEGYLVFEEEGQAGPNGPAIKLVVDKMFDNRHNLKKLFVPVEELNDELVLNGAEKVFKKYHKTEQYLIFEKAQNKPGKDARKPLKSEQQIARIPLDSLIKFANGKSSRIAT